MFTITNRLRMLVAVGAVGAALASSSVASAASVFQKFGTVTPVVASQSTTVAKYIDPDNVGSAGIAGYDDEMCESLANQHNDYESDGLARLRAGDAQGFNAYMDAADQAEDELGDHCMVTD